MDDKKRTLDWEDLRVFVAVARQGGYAAAARALGVNHATVAKSVGRMEKAGLVERRESDRDRRITLVYLTAAGRALHDKVIQTWRHLEELTAGELTADERAAFLQASDKIRRAMGREDIQPAVDAVTM